MRITMDRLAILAGILAVAACQDPQADIGAPASSRIELVPIEADSAARNASPMTNDALAPWRGIGHLLLARKTKAAVPDRLSNDPTRLGGTLPLGRDTVPADGMFQRRAFRQDTVTPR